jgi:hypothetical protein
MVVAVTPGAEDPLEEGEELLPQAAKASANAVGRASAAACRALRLAGLAELDVPVRRAVPAGPESLTHGNGLKAMRGNIGPPLLGLGP